MVQAPPSADAQIAFLAKLQRLFAEGDFTATYKFALLIALADLAVELGSDDGRELSFSTRQIAERFVHLYWRHTSPYGTGRPGTTPAVLAQNTGAQAAVLTAINGFRALAGAATVQQATKHSAYGALITRVSATVSAQPLTYLQNFGGGTDPFLYGRPSPGLVVLKPGIAFCLRRFHVLVQQLARAHWVEHIKRNRLNHSILGDAGDLEDFLFASSRQSLLAMGQSLRKLDGDRCFYCDQALTLVDVDHFIPFSLYARDLAHNLVLAHPTCNRSKSDALAARPHLDKWLSRLLTRRDAVSEIGLASGVATDAVTTEKVAAWGYANSRANDGRAWVGPARFEPVDDGYIELFSQEGQSAA